MGKSSSKAPAAPNPVTTANAQENLDKSTSLYNAQLNDVNQYTPYGNETYTFGKNADGSPSISSNITLTPQEQALFNQQTQNQTQAGAAAQTALTQYQSAAGPINYSNFQAIPTSSDIQGAEQSAIAAQSALLSPQLQQQQEQLQSQLANQGLSPGTQAYANAYNNFNNLQSQTLANETLNASQYASQEDQTALANRNQQINEAVQAQQLPLSNYATLSGQSGVTNPTFQNTATNQTSNANLEGDVNSSYQAALNAYNANNSSNNSVLGSIFGLGGSFLGAAGNAGGIASLFKGL